MLLGFSDFTVGRYIEATVTNEEELLIAPVEPFSPRKPKIIAEPQSRKTTVVAPKYRRYCELDKKKKKNNTYLIQQYQIEQYLFYNAHKENVKLGESVHVYTCML